MNVIEKRIKEIFGLLLMPLVFCLAILSGTAQAVMEVSDWMIEFIHLYVGDGE